jgi:hypothetical protein
MNVRKCFSINIYLKYTHTTTIHTQLCIIRLNTLEKLYSHVCVEIFVLEMYFQNT